MSCYEKYPHLFRNCYCGYYPKPDWELILDKLFAQFPTEGVDVVQVKEKFGGLRVYLDQYNEDLEKLIKEAEREVWEFEKAQRQK